MNLAKTTSPSSKGRVRRSSKVPLLRSSAKLRIVIAGMRNKRTQGAKVKKGSIDATPPDKMFQGPGNTHRKSPINRRKAAMTTYPIKELKKPRISLKIRALIVDAILNAKCTKSLLEVLKIIALFLAKLSQTTPTFYNYSNSPHFPTD